MDNIFSVIEEMTRLQTELELAEVIQNYDFIVGSKEIMYKLTKVLPKDAKIVYSPYLDNPNLVYAVKKYDTLDIFKAERLGLSDGNERNDFCPLIEAESKETKVDG